MYKGKNIIKNVFKIDERVNQKIKVIFRKQNYIPITQSADDDIFMVGFPKSGNTWMQNLISGVLYGIDTNFLPDSLTQELVPDVHTKIFYKRFFDITFFKTHDLPKPRMKRVIHLIRDGRDAIASYHAMNKAMDINGSLEDMIIRGENIYPCKWHEHSSQWIKNPYGAKKIVVKYESLLSDPIQEMKKILDFANIKRSDEIIKKAVEGNSFERMKNKEKIFGRDNKKWNSKKDFFRKGKVGSYKEEISESLINYFEEESKEILQYFNYKIN